MTRIRPLAVLAALALSASLAVPGLAAAKPTITMSGSTTVAPLAALLAKKYLSSCGHCVNFKLLQGGSDVGISDVASGRVTIGNASRDPKPSDPGGLVFNKIAHDAVCIITHKSNPLPGLDQAGVQAIFGGSVRSWSQVPGAKASGPIDVYVRTPASGTQDAFQKVFLGSTKVFGGAPEKPSNGRIQLSVKNDPNAIGYVSLFYAQGAYAVPYKGVACTERNAKSGQYGGQRNLYMVTRGPAKGAAKEWIKWITKSSAAASVINTEWVSLQ
ncbi:MAG: phosphate ABC transporter substrate-binding protein [Solirubrobacterales bacterium]